MYKKILVPLDGSALAECVLDHVSSIVKGCSIPEVILLRVIEPEHIPIGYSVEGALTIEDARKAEIETDAQNKQVAGEYLNKIIHSFTTKNADFHAEVQFGKPAETIIEYAERNLIDLIILATHGRSGVSRWVWGSTADKILRGTLTPVLMVRPPGCHPVM